MPKRIKIASESTRHRRPQLGFGIVFSPHGLDTECLT